MTAPDPELTDLIAAHRWDDRRGICECMYSPEFGPGTRYERMGVKAWAAHVALVVEQHTNGRTTELHEQRDSAIEAGLAAIDRAEKAEAGRSQIKDALWTIMSQLDSQAEYLGTGDDGTEWINYARNKIQKAYVECGLHLELDAGRAALEGEQQ